jgi:hypothetical protein
MGKKIDEIKKELSRKRSAAGRAGGLTTVRRYGNLYMRAIGRRGARVFHARYKFVAVFENDFAIVDRETNLTKAFLSGLPFEG